MIHPSTTGAITMKRVAIYLRVSTSKQETGNQRRELEAVAKRSGWQVVRVFEDAGISGAKGRDQRPGLDAMMKAVNAKEFDMVAAWSVDRLGRSLTDLLSILQGLTRQGRRSVPASAGPRHLDDRRQGDVSDAGRVRRVRARHHSRAVNAGLARARANGTKLGRRRVKPEVEKRILSLRKAGMGILKIGREVGVGTGVVQRVLA